MNKMQELKHSLSEVIRIADELIAALTSAEKATSANWVEIRDSAKRSMEVHDG